MHVYPFVYPLPAGKHPFRPSTMGKWHVDSTFRCNNHSNSANPYVARVFCCTCRCNNAQHCAKKPPVRCRGFFLCLCLVNERLHSGGAFLAHLLGYMAVDIQREGRGCVAQILRYRLDVIAVLQGQGGEGVPLRYNYDKPEKPRRIKGFEVFSLVFSSFSKPKNHTEISRIIGGVSLTTNE